MAGLLHRIAGSARGGLTAYEQYRKAGKLDLFKVQRL